MKFSARLLAAALLFAAVPAFATVPHKPVIPDVEGYKTLKGDFHVHTVFSDAGQWPGTRVVEGYYDGLDVMSITDHLDTRHRKMVNKGIFVDEACDRNKSYEIAKGTAKKYGMQIIHGAELTRGARMMAGHFNTHFIKDATSICEAAESEDKSIADVKVREQTAILNGLRAARTQGAFITWNHPNWAPQAPNETVWTPFIEQLYQAGLIDAIEIENHSIGFCPEAFHWAMERNLTIVSGTDCHAEMCQLVDYEAGEYRSYTLIFAKENTPASVREALNAHRTAVYNDGYFYGSEKNLKPLFDASLEVEVLSISKSAISLRLRNLTSMPIYLDKAPGSENACFERCIKLSPFEEENLKITPIWGGKAFTEKNICVNWTVRNYLTDVDKPLKVSYKYSIK